MGQSMSRPMSRDKADALLLIISCALVLAPHAAHLPLWTTFASTAILAWRGWVTFRGNRMPPRWLLLPITALAMAGVYWNFKTFFGRDSGVAMLVLLLVFKLLEMHAKRDLFVVVYVSFFLMLTNFFYSQSILTAVMMIAAVFAILTTQLSFQFTGAVPSLLQRLRLGGLILGLALPLTLVLFFLFPRIQGPLWGLPTDAQAGRSGLSDTMAPGNISSLALSDDVVFRVKFTDVVPVKSKLYWRGIVLGDYDGRTWTQRPQSGKPNVNIHTRGAAVRYQITQEANGRRWLFALEQPLAIPKIAGNVVAVTQDLQITTRNPLNDRVRYDVVSAIDFDMQANESQVALRDWLELPPNFNPQTLAFAATLRNQTQNEQKLVDNVLQFFREKNFRYTLEPPLLGRDAVDDFLFKTQAGFCEHYASSFVVLMRALDIPARVVTGYQGGDVNEVDGFMTIRQSDAHAWAEVWLEKRGWVRVDPTAAVAPERIELNLARVLPRTGLGALIGLDLSSNSWLSGLRLRLDATNNAWNQWILNYSPERQKSFMQTLGFKDPDWRTLIALLLVAGTCAMAVVVLPLLINRTTMNPADALYHALCRQMEKSGMKRATHEGPRAYGMRLTAAESPLDAGRKAAVRRFVELYEIARYGRVDEHSPSATITQLKILLSETR
ncbi:MAG: DUF3488 domain-containing protein [Herminiimonas sp.]|nr:DUF3488 domain-containing protein [Herminiimonas sp.]